jgi:glycosyltransferase involved in cell wall biosynthesis
MGAVLELPAQLQPLADAGRARVRRLFTWDAKAAQVLDVYRWVLEKKPSAHPVPFPMAGLPA